MLREIAFKTGLFKAAEAWADIWRYYSISKREADIVTQ